MTFAVQGTDTVVDDYELVDVASGDPVRLSELFSAPDRTLVLYHFMDGQAQTDPCPLCTTWIAGYNSAAPHLRQNVDSAVVATKITCGSPRPGRSGRQERVAATWDAMRAAALAGEDEAPGYRVGASAYRRWPRDSEGEPCRQ